MKTLRLDQLKIELSKEWNKSKASNLKRDKNGKIIDTRIPRDPVKIRELQKFINGIKEHNKTK